MKTSSINGLIAELIAAAGPRVDEPRAKTPREQAAPALRTLKGFIGQNQLRVVRSCLNGEEGQYFADKMIELAGIVEKMPHTYQQEALGEQAIISLHYFGGCADVWITEKDKGSPDDAPEDYQCQAFGITDLGHGPEMGYVSLPEILAAGLELDFHFKPCTIEELNKRKEKAA